MKHESEKSMFFYFLNKINYNQPLEKMKSDIGYDLGDFSFENKECYEKIKRLAVQNWIELNNFFK